MKFHFISIGGAAMHNIALDLHAQGHTVTGSDDEIYEPSLGRLQKAGLAPKEFGWFEDKITKDLDIVILGMHAKIDNPELIRAQKIGLEILSYPAYVYQASIAKKRVVIAGSHGKTTTTAMILHVLRKLGKQFDYLVGAQLEGFDRMVKLTDADLIIIEGDEYLSSPIDLVPKIHHYQPNIAVITGIAWDHINVFPTFEKYKEQFLIFINTIKEDGVFFYDGDDTELSQIVNNSKRRSMPYQFLTRSGNETINYGGSNYHISIIGQHNLKNMNSALLVCLELGIEANSFFEAIADFKGANKRLQLLLKNNERAIYLDFAHAPSKVKATVTAFKDWFAHKPLLAALELHTFSSLNMEFIPQYQSSLNAADHAIVFFNEHTLKMKNMPALKESFLRECFNHPNLEIMTDELKLYRRIMEYKNDNILLMTSGNFNNMSLNFETEMD